MKVSTKTRYGVRFMIDLAQHQNEGCVALKEVAERQGISKKYLEQVVSPLASAGLLEVTRGYMGGYRLARDPQDITLAEVVDASEDGLALLDCLSGSAPCNRQEHCSAQRIWGGMAGAMRSYLAGITLAEAAQAPDCAELTSVAVD